MNSNACLLGCALLILHSPLLFANGEAGKTIMAKGQVEAVNQNSGNRALSRRSPVFQIDRVNTGPVSVTQLRMVDGALLSLQEQSELLISDYLFDQQSRRGKVNLSLLKGGLRTVTGALIPNNNDYQLVTPIASIGVRGTHYEVELFQGDLYLASWEGAIEVTVDITGDAFSLGPSLDFRFAIVRSDGSVEFFVNAPKQFAKGHSNDSLSSPTLTDSQANLIFAWSNILQSISQREQADTYSVFGQELVNNDQLIARLLPDEQSVIRSGNATFDEILRSDFSSSAGEVVNLTLSITVDFTTASIPTGHLSFNDSQGEWFAAFNGLLNSTALDLSINFAAHNNQLADGFINALFIDDATKILGNVELFEINDSSIRAGGTFLLRERFP